MVLIHGPHGCCTGALLHRSHRFLHRGPECRNHQAGWCTKLRQGLDGRTWNQNKQTSEFATKILCVSLRFFPQSCASKTAGIAVSCGRAGAPHPRPSRRNAVTPRPSRAAEACLRHEVRGPSAWRCGAVAVGGAPNQRCGALRSGGCGLFGALNVRVRRILPRRLPPGSFWFGSKIC